MATAAASPPKLTVSNDAVTIAINKCTSLQKTITETLISPSKISDTSKHTLLRLVAAELRFLSRLSSLDSPDSPSLRSSNIGYLESIVRILQTPSISKVSRVCKPVGGSVHVDSGVRSAVCERSEGGSSSGSDDLFLNLISGMREISDDSVLVGYGAINVDTTALIALVSGISNGGTKQLIDAPEVDLKKKFKGNYEFVMAQVQSELNDPILVELKAVVAGKKGIICESVYQEFMGLISMCGGPNEKYRAKQLLNCLTIVPIIYLPEC